MSAYKKRIHFRGDGLDLTAEDYAALLHEIVETRLILMDSYSLGGCVEELEHVCAKMLNKEQAIFMPTGTLANHIAIRALIGQKGRVLTQKMSHLYCDSGDGLQRLYGVNVVPLGHHEATFSLDEVKEQIALAETGRVETGVGVISIETPVRRKHGAMFDVEELKNISRYAREQGMKLHLDGARIVIASAYTGMQPSEYAGYFDTVYVSLYKYFNAPSGAILAGPSELIKPLFHIRRMYGGGLNQVWPFAACALYFFDGFPDRLKSAIHHSEIVKAALAASSSFEVENIPNGSNVFKLHVRPDLDLKALQHQLRQDNIWLPEPDPAFHGYLLKVNESLNFMPPEQLAEYFLHATR